MKTNLNRIHLSLLAVLFFFVNQGYTQSYEQLDSLRIVYEKTNLDSALNYAQLALKKVEESHEKKDSLYSSALNNVAVLAYNLGRYEEAKPLFEEFAGLQKAIYGEKHPEYAKALSNLGFLYVDMAMYNDAEALLDEALKIHKNAQGKENIEYANVLDRLVVLYYYTGKYDQLESSQMEVIRIRKDLLGEEHPDYIAALSTLATVYNINGETAKAEKLFVEILELQKELFGDADRNYLLTASNLATLYHILGNFKKAEDLYRIVLEGRKKLLGDQHPDYAQTLNNLAAFYADIAKYIENEEEVKLNYAKAEKLYIEAINLKKEVLGDQHPSYASSLNNLAYLYADMEENSKAVPLLMEAISIYETAEVLQNIEYVNALTNLGYMYSRIAHEDTCAHPLKWLLKAEPLLIKSKDVYKSVYGNKHPGYGNSLNNLSVLYDDFAYFTENKEYEKKYDVQTIKYCLKSIDVLNQNIDYSFSFLSEKEKEAFMKTKFMLFDSFYSLVLDKIENSPEIVESVYNNAVRNKGRLLKSSTALRFKILRSQDSTLINNYNNWLELNKELAQLYSQMQDNKEQIKNLEERANFLEKELVFSSQLFEDYKNSQTVNWKDIRNNLAPKEAVIEFIHFNYYERNASDKIIYCALIVNPDSKYPEMIRLFNEDQLIDILGKYGGNNLNYITDIYGTNSNTKTALYNLIWKPIEESLEGVKRVYVSPSGLLHKISFSAIAKDQNVYLCDLYDVNVQSTTGNIVLKEDKPFEYKNSTATIFGGVNYNGDSTDTKLWNYLEGTKTETQNISKLLKKKKVQVNFYTASTATERAFKHSASNSNILHVATHGFFYPDPEKVQEEMAPEMKTGNVAFLVGSRGFGVSTFVENENPLMRSGLVLAGANDVWNMEASDTTEDGVLTAQEIAYIDMRKTNLVVMSACETGLGDIRGSEGVYGLQRSFKMAGADKIIMSLWQIPDKETEEFMTMFYKKLLKEKNIRTAFNQTQKEMRDKYDPYFWAAFVLIE